MGWSGSLSAWAWRKHVKILRKKKYILSWNSTLKLILPKKPQPQQLLGQTPNFFKTVTTASPQTAFAKRRGPKQQGNHLTNQIKNQRRPRPSITQNRLVTTPRPRPTRYVKNNIPITINAHKYKYH